jgi:hypothetical protein
MFLPSILGAKAGRRKFKFTDTSEGQWMKAQRIVQGRRKRYFESAHHLG